MLLSFDGGGWMYPFCFGVAAFVQENMQLDNFTFAGVSCGACAAAALSLGISLRPYFEDAINVYDYARCNPFQMSTALKDVFIKHAPDDSTPYTQSNRKLHIGVSSGNWMFCRKRPEIISNFINREHTIECIRASAHLPFFAGVRGYAVNDSLYFDGGCTMDFADEYMDTDRVIRVSPWRESGEMMIGSDRKFPPLWSYFPPSKDTLKSIFELGFQKAKLYFNEKLLSFD